MSTRLAFSKHPAWLACFLAAAGLLPAEAPGPRPGEGKERMPLWQAAIRHTREKGHYVAACVSSEMSVYDGDEKLLGTVSEVERLAQDQGKPQWKLESKKQTGSPGMTIRADFGLQADPASALEGYDEWHLQGKKEVDGRAVEIWEGTSQANPPNKVIASIDVESGFPRKAEFTIPFHFPLLSQVVTMTLTYAPGADGVWLPARSVCDQKGRLLLLKRHILLTKTYTDWESTGR
jgi:hypothetical protein